MPAGDRDGHAGDENARPRDESEVDRVAHGHVCVARALGIGVPQRREPRFEGRARGCGAFERPEWDRLVQNGILSILRRETDMRVRVDQSRQHGVAGQINGAGAWWYAHIRTDSDDPIVLDDDECLRDRPVAGAVHEATGANHDARRLGLGASGMHRERAEKHHRRTNGCREKTHPGQRRTSSDYRIPSALLRRAQALREISELTFLFCHRSGKIVEDGVHLPGRPRIGLRHGARQRAEPIVERLGRERVRVGPLSRVNADSIACSVSPRPAVSACAGRLPSAAAAVPRAPSRPGSVMSDTRLLIRTIRSNCALRSSSVAVTRGSRRISNGFSNVLPARRQASAVAAGRRDRGLRPREFRADESRRPRHFAWPGIAQIPEEPIRARLPTATGCCPSPDSRTPGSPDRSHPESRAWHRCSAA